MDSEADSSVFGPSTTQNSVQGVSGRSRGAPASAVWAHCRTARVTALVADPTQHPPTNLALDALWFASRMRSALYALQTSSAG
jgi:hypothetical protein